MALVNGVYRDKAMSQVKANRTIEVKKHMKISVYPLASKGGNSFKQEKTHLRFRVHYVPCNQKTLNWTRVNFVFISSPQLTLRLQIRFCTTHRLFFVFVGIPKQQIMLEHTISNLLAIKMFEKTIKRTRTRKVGISSFP